MKKIFKFNIFRTGYILGMIIVPFPLLLGIWGMFLSFQQNQPMIVIILAGCLVFGSAVACYMMFFYFNKLQVKIDGNIVHYIFPGQNVSFDVKNIVGIRKAFRLNGVGYCVYYNSAKGKKKHIDFTQDLNDSEQLIEYLEKKSNIKMRQAGTLEVKETDKSFVKILKIIFNIIVVLGLLWILVLWPVLHAHK